MARINLLDTRTPNFGELIGNGKIYRVPPFQRDYSWQEENWEDLWQDILALYEDPDSSHYMGAIVLYSEDTSEKQFTIIDGQQRIATLSIIAIAAIEQIHQISLQESDPTDNREREDILKRTYLADKDPRSLRYSSKLLLNENNNDFYQSNLVNLRKPRNVRSLSKSNQLLWQAFEYFSSRLQRLPDVTRNGESLARFLTDTIAQRLLFIQINVENELNAYTVFETLNARGLELSSTDLLKNYLFSVFRGPDDRKEAQRRWRQLINIVSMEKFPEFLRYYLSLRHAKVRRERLFKLVRDSVKSSQQAFDLLDDLIENYSSLYIALGNPNDEFWYDTPANPPLVRELALFGVKQVYPLLFAAYDRFSPTDFTRLLKLATVISFRYLIVGGLNPNELESAYNTVARAIVRGEITTPRGVFESLRSIYVSDEKFQQDFSLLSIPTGKQKKKLVRYILTKLENDASGLEINEDSFSIEHILPEFPNETWRAEFSDRQMEDMVYRIGNLTLLELSFNRSVGNSSYPVKLETYAKSCYRLTRQITAPEWTPDSISHRQQQLARRAIAIWKTDFAD